MLTAITHAPSPSLNRCELIFLSPQAIDIQTALHQHQAYCDLLCRCGVDVIVLGENRSLPDSVFVAVVDVSEFLNAEAGLTCMSLIFNNIRNDDE